MATPQTATIERDIYLDALTRTLEAMRLYHAAAAERDRLIAADYSPKFPTNAALFVARRHTHLEAGDELAKLQNATATLADLERLTHNYNYLTGLYSRETPHV